MAGTIYLRFGEHDAAWVIQDLDGFAREQRGSLTEAADRAASGLRTVVLVPGAHVLLTQTDLALQNRQKLRQAVPYAIEEQLSDDVENLHFALGTRREAEGLPVAVVARERLKGWLARLAEAGLQPNSVVPDVLAVPLAAGEWSLLLGQEGVLLRTGTGRGYALDVDDTALLLGMALEQAGEARPERLRIFDARDDGIAQSLAPAAEAHGIAVTTEACPHGELGMLARQLTGQPVLELLQGEFSRREQLGKLWRPWRFAAAVLGVLLLLQGGMAAFDYLRLGRESRFLSQRIEEVYRQTFPEARNVVDPRKQMEDKLAALRGGTADDFVALLAGSASIVQSGGTEITAMNYKDGTLAMDIHLADLQALDRLKQELAGKGFGVDIQTANSRAGKVEARVQLRGTK